MMASEYGLLERIKLLTSAAACEPSHWSTVLSLLQQAIGSHGCALFTPLVDPEGQYLSVSSGSMMEATAEYVQSWAPHDAWIIAAAEKRFFQTAGEVRTGVDALDQKALRRTEFYSGFLRPHDIEHIVSMKVCDGSDGVAPPTHLSFYAPSRSAGFDEEHKRFLRTLWPHLHRAIETHWTLVRAQHAMPAVEGLLDAMGHPAWVVRDDGLIEYANLLASELMASKRIVKTASQRLLAVGNLASDELTRAIGAACLHGGCVIPVAIVAEKGVCRATLRMAPIKDHQHLSIFWREASALLVLEMPAKENSTWLTTLRKHYRLTEGEARILERLMAGDTPKQVAEHTSLSVATVRTHMRALFNKTGCRRQADLMRLAS